MTRQPLLPEECFTAAASAQRAARIHASYRKLLMQSILSSIDSAAEGLKMNLSPLRQRYEQIGVARKFSPALYAAQSNLTAGMHVGRVTSVLDGLKQLQLLTDEEIFDCEFRTQSVLTESWEWDFLRDVRAQNPEDKEDGLIMRPILTDDLSSFENAVAESRDLLTEVDAELLGEFDEYVTRLKLFSGTGVYGFTTPRVFGAIYLQAPPSGNLTEYFLEHLVHELSHLTLNTLMAHDPLLNNPVDESERSPLRSDSRPLYQVLHATFVLSRVVGVFRQVVESHSELGFDQKLEEFEQQYANGYDAVQAEANPTPAGERLIASLEQPACAPGAAGGEHFHPF